MSLFNFKNRVVAFKNNAKYFQYRPWQIVSLFDKYNGVWPGQNKFTQYPLRIFHFANLLIIILATVNGLLSLTGYHYDLVIENLVVILFVFSLTIKQIASFIFERRRHRVYEKVNNHYRTLTDPEEAAMLRKSADQGLTFTAGYICTASLLVGLVDGIPTARGLYHYYMGISELKLLPFEMNYGVDHEKYCYGILLQFFLFVHCGFVVDIGFDLSFILQIRHVEALFKIVRVRLEKMSKLVGEGLIKKEETYPMIVSAIRLHEECFQTVKITESIHHLVWLGLLLLNCSAFGGILHLMTTRLHDPLEILREFCGFSLLTMHAYIIFSHGQKIIDSNESIYDTCSQSDWLNLPAQSRKLMTVMMIRSTKVCQITGGKFFPLSMEMFGIMFKAGLSYYTVFER